MRAALVALLAASVASADSLPSQSTPVRQFTSPWVTSDNHTTAAAPISCRLTDGSAFYTATGSGGAGGALSTSAKGTTAAGSPTSVSVDANTQALHTWVTNFPASQAVTGTFWQATQPVSGPLTDTQLRASAVPVSGTFFQATQPVSGAVTANAGTGTMSVAGTGTAGVPGTAVLTVQGVASGTSVNVAQGTAASLNALVAQGAPAAAANSWFVKPSTNTGGATPGQAMLAGAGAVARGAAPNGTVSGNLSMLTADPDSRLYVNDTHPNYFSCKVDAAVALTQCQAAPASGSLNVVDVVVTNGGTAQTVTIQMGTGTACATGATTVVPAINLPVSGTVAVSFRQPIRLTALNALCCKPSGTTAFGCLVNGYTSSN